VIGGGGALVVLDAESSGTSNSSIMQLSPHFSSDIPPTTWLPQTNSLSLPFGDDDVVIMTDFATGEEMVVLGWGPLGGEPNGKKNLLFDK